MENTNDDMAGRMAGRFEVIFFFFYQIKFSNSRSKEINLSPERLLAPDPNQAKCQNK